MTEVKTIDTDSSENLDCNNKLHVLEQGFGPCPNTISPC